MKPMPPVSAFALKVAAIVGMTCNHIANVFGTELPGGVMVALYSLGGLTFPIMAYLLCATRPACAVTPSASRFSQPSPRYPTLCFLALQVTCSLRSSSDWACCGCSTTSGRTCLSARWVS